jgi:hypothetical protein
MRRFGIIMICLIGMVAFAMGIDPKVPPLQINGAKVSTGDDAKAALFRAYLDKVHAPTPASDSIADINLVTLGFDIGDFAKKGERIWEGRIRTIGSHRLRGIIWIHPNTQKAHFVHGYWDKNESVE